MFSLWGGLYYWIKGSWRLVPSLFLEIIATWRSYIAGMGLLGCQKEGNKGGRQDVRLVKWKRGVVIGQGMPPQDSNQGISEMVMKLYACLRCYESTISVLPLPSKDSPNPKTQNLSK